VTRRDRSTAGASSTACARSTGVGRKDAEHLRDDGDQEGDGANPAGRGVAKRIVRGARSKGGARSVALQ
jgi:hypothetical protein